MKENKCTSFEVPNKNSILKGTAIAVLVGVVILVTVIMPVEYDLDPTGIGETLGLTAISAAARQPGVAPVNETVIVSSKPGTVTPPTPASGTGVDPLGVEWFLNWDPYGPPETNPAAATFTENYETVFQAETITIPLQVDGELEYKFQMQEGQVLLYHWDSGGKDLYFEFHAEPTEGEFPEGYYMSYQIGDPSTGESGTLVAPFTGNHGWYFLNLTSEAATITLEVSGYYESHGRLH